MINNAIDANVNTPLSNLYGGTGISNPGTISFPGGFSFIGNLTGNTNVTFPTSGTLATTGGTIASITGTANQVLVNGTSGTPQTGAVTLTTPQNIATTSSPTFAALTLTSPLTVANGGTGLATLSTYRILAAGTTATGALQQVVAGTAGQLLQSNGAGALPTWTTSTFPSGSGTLNHMLRSDGTNWVQTTLTTLDASDNFAGITSAGIGNLSIATNTISSVSGNINLIPTGTNTVNIGATTSFVLQGGLVPILEVSQAVADSVVLFSGISTGPGDVGAGNLVINGTRGTAVNSHLALQNGDRFGTINFFGDDGTTYINSANIACDVDGAVSAGAVPSSLTFYTSNALGGVVQAARISSSQILTLTNPLPVGSGGLGIATTPSNGQIPIGNGSTYTAATLTAGTGVSITNASGSVTINAAGGGLTWSTIAGTTQAAAVNHGYITSNVANTTITLPATCAIGDVVEVQGFATPGWFLVANTGQTIKYGAQTTSSGGILTAALGSDNVSVVCVVANTTWKVQWSTSTGLTYT